MEKDEIKKTQETKTDLNLLLQCLKYQMDNPSSQKEALVTIYSVCQQNSDASIYFREIGGLMFVKNLAKSSIHNLVKEAALFTLGAIAECNVYCQQTLCTSEFFEDIIWFLSKHESNINLKRMSVYVILVLVSNNRNGQTLVRETGCVGILLQFFRTALSMLEMDLSNETTFQSYQLWSSVCSALCACVNNPQNDVNQKICSSVFQHANKWLQSCIKPEIIRPLCSFICLTVANNTAVGVVLAKYHIVSKLLTLLLHESLDSGEKFSIILTLGHCTEACEENQLQLFKNNGLPLMIQVLTESQNEELNKAATFVLYNCKKITEKLSLNQEACSSDMNEAQQLKELKVRERNIEDFWKKAKEIFYRIKQLENKENEEETEKLELIGDPFPGNLNPQNTSEHSKMDSTDIGASEEKKCPQKQHQPLSCEPAATEQCEASTGHESQDPVWSEKANPVSTSDKEGGLANAISTTCAPSTASAPRSHSSCKGAICEKRALNLQASEQVYKSPAPVVKNRKHQTQVTDPLALCSDIISKEASIFQGSDNYPKTLNFRCSGCIEVGKSLNSRNFSRLLHSCPFQCDRHKVILEAEDRYKSDLRKSLIFNKKILLTPYKKKRFDGNSSTHEEKK
ncbi:telomere repeats-binding bouquet formation protein 1 isoform X5 [Sarcophilus harrisii]|uniref:telomere repeats-binding bouquet formation protein 1 isoform X5 n=1 Tax=Sarcophilus harrisii TaxID=9305 RepID=UPI001301F58D|nr:telomere repeats-binding bouquet formation protein 1 isoform X5 [Sarcophilus harrisii]